MAVLFKYFECSIQWASTEGESVVAYANARSLAYLQSKSSK
jgi:hypothetical protein